MDADRFDDLTRSLPAGSRRRAMAVALGGLLGLLGLESAGQAAPKKCKGLKGKKKKKCLKKARKTRKAGCRDDGDCRDQIESCLNRRCQRVCQNGSCPGCVFCLIHYTSDGNRTRRCAGSIEITTRLTTCDTDTDCPIDTPLCVSSAGISCTNGPCGTCIVSAGSCDEP